MQLRYLGFIVSLMNSFVEKDVTEELAVLRSVNSFTEIMTDCILQFKDVTENFCIFRKNGNDLLITLYVFVIHMNLLVVLENLFFLIATRHEDTRVICMDYLTV